MTGGEEEPKKGEGKGFAGLSSLVSEVDTTSMLPAPKKEPEAAAQSAGHAASQASQPRPPRSQQRQTYQEPAQPSSGGSSGGKWVLGIVAVIGVVWLIGLPNKTTTTSPAPAYSPPAQSTAPNYVPPAPAPAPAPAPPQPQAPSRPTESKPPVGRDLVFSSEQIRYCLAEDIRIDAAKSALNNYIDADVGRFNAMVADYNSRCSSFQYQTNNRGRNDLKSAHRDIEPFRNQLQSEGRSRFARAPTSSLSTPEAARPASNATVQAIQRKLNELGYEAGAADGLMGRRTRSAISAFQRDSGLVADGNATAALLQFLTTSSQAGRQEAQPPASSVAVAPPAYTPPARTPSRQESASPNSHGIPQNAHLNYLGNGWECNRGFYRAGNECRPVQAPQNASLNYLGNGWECNRGYYRAGNECAPVRTPANASLNYLGNGWECNQGFRKAGDKCVSIFER
ncbi:peptidoglycan-binding domain-containing protein [Bordetella bronchiseptica]|uniref:peptidoglycan-binding domain-containing protein n=1 Tax=Bordetella bronchiseptica TaxID=518 RepID=UPI00190FB9C6|nr:peptidoglycan-binding domain-containing protein [Bordetella bronchiseptica]